MSPQLCDILEKLCPPAEIVKIYLLGEQTVVNHRTGIFVNEADADHVPAGFLFLVLTAEGVSNKFIEELVETRAVALAPVISLVMKETNFVRAVRENNYFAGKVIAQAQLLYQCDDHSNSYDEHKLNNEDPDGALTKQPPPLSINVDAWLNRCQEFIAGAELYMVRKQPKMAAFCLHQAAEQAYTAIIYRATGFRPETHNLRRLHTIASFFISGLSYLFPSSLPLGECLLARLQKAYIDVRYTDHFYLHTDKIMLLFEKIRKLFQIAALKSQ